MYDKDYNYTKIIYFIPLGVQISIDSVMQITEIGAFKSLMTYAVWYKIKINQEAHVHVYVLPYMYMYM